MFHKTLYKGKNTVNQSACMDFCLSNGICTDRYTKLEFPCGPQITQYMTVCVRSDYKQVDVLRLEFFVRFGNLEMLFDNLAAAEEARPKLREVFFRRDQ